MVKTQYIACLMLTFFLLSSSLILFGQERIIHYDHATQVVSIGEKIVYLEDTTSQFIATPHVVLDKTPFFLQHNDQTLNFANTQSAFWFRFELQSKIEEDVYLQIKNPMLDSLVLFELDSNEQLTKLAHSGAAFPFAERAIQVTRPTFLLPISQTTSKTFFLYVKSNFPTQTSLFVGTAKALSEYNHPFDVAMGIYIGVMLVMVLYNFFLLVSTKNNIYLLYICYAFFVLLLYATFKGYTFEFLWSGLPRFHFYIPVLSSIAVLFIIYFSIYFLEVKKYAPKYKYFLYFLVSILLISIISGVVGNYLLSAVTGQLSVVLMALSLFIIAILILKRGYKPARFFLIAWSAYLTGLIIFILQLNAVIPNTWFTDNSVLFGSALEVVLLSFALADRINIYKREKEEAQQEALSQTQKNERLVREQNKILEEKVAKRTKELHIANEELSSTNEELKSTNEELNTTLETVQSQQKTLKRRAKEIEGINEELLSTNEELKLAQEQMQAQQAVLVQINEKLNDKALTLQNTNEEVSSTLEIVKKQSKVIAQKNRSITDSLRYAQTIQEAMLPFKERMDEHLRDYFVLYRPKDIVSGDFYWLTDVGGKVFFAVADCTGHGVPGAFMSMIGSAALDALVNRNRLTNPNEILSELHLMVQKALKQESNTNNDGMDIGLCILEYLPDGRCKIVFAGAKLSLFYYKQKEKEFCEIRGTRQRIGGVLRRVRVPFDTHELILEKGDCFYMLSDGYIDQNNAKNERFSSIRVRDMLQEIGHLPIFEQEVIITERLITHQGNEHQRDDITFIGARIS